MKNRITFCPSGRGHRDFAPAGFPQIFLAICVAILLTAMVPVSGRAADKSAKKLPPAICTTGRLPSGQGEDLIIDTGTCEVHAGTYNYHNVNIYGGGRLDFVDDGDTHFWAESILVENNGTLSAGTSATPYGVNGTLTIHLWGADQGTTGQGGQGIVCLADKSNQCGVPDALWKSNCPGGDCSMSMTINPSSCTRAKNVDGWKQNLPGNVDDCFYAYDSIKYDGAGTPKGYVGYKVLAVTFGGTLQLFGLKGALADPQKSSESGNSWVHLTTTLAGTGKEKTFTVSRVVDWKKGDQIVLTTTDYVAGHSEALTLASDPVVVNGVSQITTNEAIAYPHYGKTYNMSLPTGVGPDTGSVDTRAAVALLTRSIRIVSGGNNDGDPFPAEPNDGKPGYYFGGHVLFRQGFQTVQVRGVEFAQLGQGGRIMHYPIHFHMARKTPQPALGDTNPVTFVEDSSVWDSMTRWITLHATQGVTLARNVGYKSIGHGYYLEDATETDNKFYSNIGIFARAAVINPQNKRQVPGILAAPFPDPTKSGQEEVPFHTDIDHPTDFWITNSWNDFEYNYAAGAGTCGACYWMVPAANSTMSRYEYWWSYASEQKWNATPKVPNSQLNRAAMTPIKDFVGNSCSSAMNAFNTIGDTAPCFGVVNQVNTALPRMQPVTQGSLAPIPANDPNGNYYPQVTRGGGRFSTECPEGDTDCSTAVRCDGDAIQNCLVSVLDHFTTSFNYTEFNFAAVWLRPQWYLLSNSSITDVQNGGLTFVTGGGYTRSDAIKGHWAVARNDAFVGHTQPTAANGGNPYADDSGPFNPETKKLGFTCALQESGATAGNYCLNVNQGMIMLLSNFGNNQRLFNIYDGPAYQEDNAYLDINTTTLTDCKGGGNCSNSGWMYGQVSGVPKDPKGACYLPNAAIGWKQPNGFYYPPAFHSDNLFFNNVDIRHFVIEPLFTPGTYNTDATKLSARYCTYGGIQFEGYTDIDRQTELTDDDGSLTGLLSGDKNGEPVGPTESVNKDSYFNAPVEDLECASDAASNMPPSCNKNAETCGTARTSPYGLVTTVEYPDCNLNCPQLADPNSPDSGHWWTRDCATPACFGVPLYREDVNPDEKQNGAKPFIRMAGQGVAQRSTLTMNHGTYYMDTTVSQDKQTAWSGGPGNYRGNLFKGGHTYYTFFLYAEPGPDEGKTGLPATHQTYEMYVGTKDFNQATDVFPVQVNVATNPFVINDKASVPTENFTVNYVQSTGMLTVTMDMGFDDFKTNYNKAHQDHCQPASFCSWDPAGNGGQGSCGCALSSGDSLYKQCTAVCTKWTNKDVDCPEGGCYGFGVKLPDSFEAQNQGVAPAPSCYPNDDNWNIKFNAVDQTTAGSCYYKTAPPIGTFCSKQGF